MKKTKILVPALAVLALGMAASVTGTVAWFAANNVVYANGMQIQSSTPSSLAIGQTLTNNGIGDATSITYASATNILNPCSHFNGTEVADGSLFAVANGNDIDPATGLAMPYVAENHLGVDTKNNNTNAAEADGYRDLTYADATLASHNYVDYVCYLASVGQAIEIGENGYLQVKINWGDEVNQTTYATTVDFWVNESASTSNDTIGTYVGTLNRAGVLASSAHAGAPLANDWAATTTAGEDVTLVTLLDVGANIPVNTGSAAIRVTMRVYLDGALLETNAKTYVTTNDVDTDGIDINTVFTLERGQQD